MGRTKRHGLLKLPALDVGRAIPILGALAEVLWAYPWLAWLASRDLFAWPGPPLALASAIALVVAAEVLSHTALARGWQLARVRMSVLPALVLLLALIVRLEMGGGYALWDVGWTRYAGTHAAMLLSGLAFGAYLVWRGISVGREGLATDVLYRRFLMGLAGLVALLILSGITSEGNRIGRTVAATGPYVVAYFSVGLLALALANFYAIRQTMLDKSDASDLFSRRWLSLAVGAVLGIALVSVLVAGIFSFDLVAMLAHPLGVLGDWLLTAFIYLVGYPLGVLAAALIYAFRALRGLLGPQHDISPERFSPPNIQDLRQATEGQAPSGIPPWVMPALKWGLVALAVLLVVYLLARALTRYVQGKAEEEVVEVHESLWSWGLFTQDIRSFLAGLLRRFMVRRKPVTPVAAIPEAVQAGGQERVFTVREIYQALLWEGRQVGLAHRPWETPYEYGARLRDTLVPATEELGAITEAYIADRYGGMALGPGPLRLVNQRWRALRLALHSEAPHAGPSP